MTHATRSVQIFCSLLAQGALVLSTIPMPKSAVGRAEPISDVTTEENPMSDILHYISTGWDNLTRAMNRCESLEDTKTGGEAVLYLPAEVSTLPAISELQNHCRVRVEHLPARIMRPGGMDSSGIKDEGLLYLENPYVVPGGQFNEMYGWDSYFIIRGLLRDHRLELAKGMVDNFFFEISHYGGVLNANRTYYLTRSKPPFLRPLIMAVYEAEKAAGKQNASWLEQAYQSAVRDYDQWTHEPHLAGDTGLSRYFDHGDGPVPEIRGDPNHYYRGVAYYFLVHGGSHEDYLVQSSEEHSSGPTAGPSFPVHVCDPQAVGAEKTDCAPR